ncbi:MAG: hypothetical protein IJT61_09355 [Bacteroidales bacterium]|nr:hypothetical protein [Bacteroidales bacterium]
MNEGRSLLYGYDGEYKIQFDVGVGSEAIMLCASLCNSYTNDKGISCSQSIEIFDVPGLVIAIAEQLQSKGYKVRSILHGSCFYTEKEFHQVIDSENFRKKLDKGVFDYDEMTKINQSISGYNIYFQKAVEKRMENEYRMIWLVDDLKEGENFMVTIQNPEKYCRKVKAI